MSPAKKEPKVGDVVVDDKGVETTYKAWGRLIIYPDGTAVPIIKDRREYVIDPDFSIAPDSLLGSAFHVLQGGVIIWQGVIVAEPEAGRYLCDIDVLEAGAFRVQRVFSLDVLMGVGEDSKRLIEGSMAEARADVVNPHVEWRLYDNLDAANAAFTQWALQAAADKEREEARNPDGTSA